MNILLVGNKFFGYTERVKEYLSKENEVDVIYIYQPSFIDRIYKKFVNKSRNYMHYYKHELEKCNNKYEKILIFGGGAPVDMIKLIKEKYTSIPISIYLSADMASYGFSKDYISLFDRVLTYSLNDSKEYGFIYRPWFYTHTLFANKIYDVSFVGTIHDSRLEWLLMLSKKNIVTFFYYIYTDVLTYLKHFLRWYSLLKYTNFKGLAYEKYIGVLASSIATLDLPDSKQTNITTRPIESLGTKTKIITTNQYIENYDFYNSNNIFILKSSSTIEEIKNWLSIPYTEIDKNVLSFYSIKTWCDEVFM